MQSLKWCPTVSLSLRGPPTKAAQTDRQTDDAWQATIRSGIHQLEQNCEGSATRVGRIKQ